MQAMTRQIAATKSKKITTAASSSPLTCHIICPTQDRAHAYSSAPWEKHSLHDIFSHPLKVKPLEHFPEQQHYTTLRCINSVSHQLRLPRYPLTRVPCMKGTSNLFLKNCTAISSQLLSSSGSGGVEGTKPAFTLAPVSASTYFDRLLKSRPPYTHQHDGHHSGSMNPQTAQSRDAQDGFSQSQS
jgi:hypothetical protein